MKIKVFKIGKCFMIFTMLPNLVFTIRGDYEGGSTLSKVLPIGICSIPKSLCSTFESANTHFQIHIFAMDNILKCAFFLRYIFNMSIL